MRTKDRRPADYDYLAPHAAPGQRQLTYEQACVMRRPRRCNVPWHRQGGAICCELCTNQGTSDNGRIIVCYSSDEPPIFRPRTPDHRPWPPPTAPAAVPAARGRPAASRTSDWRRKREILRVVVAFCDDLAAARAARPAVSDQTRLRRRLVFRDCLERVASADWGAPLGDGCRLCGACREEFRLLDETTAKRGVR